MIDWEMIVEERRRRVRGGVDLGDGEEGKGEISFGR